MCKVPLFFHLLFCHLYFGFWVFCRWPSSTVALRTLLTICLLKKQRPPPTHSKESGPVGPTTTMLLPPFEPKVRLPAKGRDPQGSKSVVKMRVRLIDLENTMHQLCDMPANHRRERLQGRLMEIRFYFLLLSLSHQQQPTPMPPPSHFQYYFVSLYSGSFFCFVWLFYAQLTKR